MIVAVELYLIICICCSAFLPFAAQSKLAQTALASKPSLQLALSPFQY